MNDLIKLIEQWAHERNIINGTKPIDQAMKLFSEFGELADNVGKGRDCRDDIGDCVVVLTIIANQLDLDMVKIVDFEHDVIEANIKDTVAFLCYQLGLLITDQEDDVEFGFVVSIGLLHSIAIKSGTTLEECVQIAYNDIKDRKGIVYNGVFIKEADPAYADAVKAVKGA